MDEILKTSFDASVMERIQIFEWYFSVEMW
jgi:hypothetical protein